MKKINFQCSSKYAHTHSPHAHAHTTCSAYYFFRPEDSAHTIVFNNPLYCEPEVASSLNDDVIKSIHDMKDTEQLID